jgi:molybdopterin converting factor small subunit
MHRALNQGVKIARRYGVNVPRRLTNVFVDGRRAVLDTRLAPGAEVFVLTAISGG